MSGQDKPVLMANGERITGDDVTLSSRFIDYDFRTYVATVQRLVRDRFTNLGVDVDTYRVPTGTSVPLSLEEYAELLCAQAEITAVRDALFDDVSMECDVRAREAFWAIFEKGRD